MHRYEGEHVAVAPVVTSNRAPGSAYGYWFGYALAGGGDAIANTDAMIGDDTLVPPNTVQPPEP